MSDYKVTDTELTNIANAIRAKTGKSAQIEFPSEFISEIGSISGGGSINILNGHDAPTASLGNNGDIYLQYYLDAPSGYKLVEYIQSSGTQIIDTGVPAKPNLKTIVDCQVLGNGDQTIIGGNGGATSVIYLGCNPNDGSCYYYNFGYGGYPAPWQRVTGISDKMRHVFESEFGLSAQIASVDGDVTLYTTYTLNGSTSSDTLHIFGRADGSAKATIRLYGLQIHDLETGNEIRHFIPCIRDSDDAIGLYDLINDVFYANTGSGTFVAGEDLVDGCILEDYLKVSGAWQPLIGSNIDDVNTGS